MSRVWGQSHANETVTKKKVDGGGGLRRKATLKSALDGIPGVGPTRRRILLKTFGSIKRVKAATVEELTGAEGVGPELAQVIFDSLK